MSQHSPASAYQLSLLMLLMSLIWGANFPIAKIGIQQVGVWRFRFLCALLSILVFMAIAGILWCKKNKHAFHLSRKNYFRLFGLAIPNTFAVPLLNSLALEQTTAVNAVILLYTMPAWASLLTMLSQRKFDCFSCAGAGCCVLGILCIGRVNDFGLGEVVILISALIWAIGGYLNQYITVSCPLKLKVFWQGVLGAVLTLIFTAAYDFSQDRYHAVIGYAPDLKILLLAALYTGVVAGVLVLWIWLALIEKQNAEFAGYATLLVPIFGMFFAWLALDEAIHPLTIVGAMFIITSLLFVMILKPRDTKSVCVSPVMDNSGGY